MILTRNLRSQRPYVAPPPPEGLPAWLSSAAVNQWVQIPNSQLITGVSDAYFTDIGLQRPSVTGNVAWMKNTSGVIVGNKYGVVCTAWEGISWAISGGHMSHSGMGFDDINSAIHVGGGDCGWAENSVQRFRYNLDSPLWDQPIASCHRDYFKHPYYPRTDPDTYPATDPGDDNRFDRMYDGSHRGGHNYHFPNFIRGPVGGSFVGASNENLYIHFGQAQYWPIDNGQSPVVHVAPRSEGLWNTGNPIADLPHFQTEALAWQQKHPETEDVYFWGANENYSIVYRWRAATNDYQDLLYLGEATPGAFLKHFWTSGSIDWENNYIFFASASSSAPFDTHSFWMMDLTTPAYVAATVVGSQASVLKPSRNGGMRWCPDIGKHLYFPDNGNVYTIEKTGATEFTVELLPMTGTGPTLNQVVINKSGAVYNCFDYDPVLHGMVLRISDTDPMLFFRTG